MIKILCISAMGLLPCHIIILSFSLFFIGWNGKQHSKDCDASWKLCRSREREHRKSCWLQEVLEDKTAYIQEQSKTSDQQGLLNESWTLECMLLAFEFYENEGFILLAFSLKIPSCHSTYSMPCMFCWSDHFELSVGFPQPIYKQTAFICFCLNG